MNNPKVEIMMMDHYKGPTPKVAHEGDAGIDLRNCTDDEVLLKAGEQQLIPTGLKMAIPEGYCGIVFERSGLGKKYGVSVHGRIIDSGYRGEVGVIISSKVDVTLPKAERIAQIVFMPILTNLEMVTELSDTKRGEDGFGSTGGQ